MTIYNKLSSALVAATKNEKIFAQELSKSGARRFIVSNKEEFWLEYLKVDPQKRNYYEVIRQNNHIRPHWDIEYNIQENSLKDGYKALADFIENIIREVKEQHKIEINNSDFLILSSHSNSKFSIHLILTPDKVFFYDNLTLGDFTKTLVEKLKPESKDLLRVKKNGKEENMIDLSIYTRNRNFRLYMSSKFGQDRMLKLDPEDLHHLEGVDSCDPGIGATLDKYIFYESLIEQESKEDTGLGSRI